MTGVVPFGGGAGGVRPAAYACRTDVGLETSRDVPVPGADAGHVVRSVAGRIASR